MSLIGQIKFLERLEYFNGQRLFASDLQAAEDFNRQMRWLHNQSLHQPGIGIGFAVSGEKGAREVIVEPGYAIDAEGREIVLTQSRRLPLPPVAGAADGGPIFYDLTVSYPDERDLEESETREGICLPRGVVRLREEPVFCWVELGPPPHLQPVSASLKADIEMALKLRLARSEVLNCELKRKISEVHRRNARPQNIPQVACGSTAGEEKQWELNSGQSFFRLRQRVDTSAAGFRTEPCYLANVIGEREIDLGQGLFAVDGFTSITETQRESFVLTYSLPNELFSFEGDFQALLEGLKAEADNKWHIDWVGVEG